MARPKRGEEKHLECDFRVRITRKLRDALDQRVKAEGKTITDVVTPMLEHGLERELLGKQATKRTATRRPRSESHAEG